MALLPLRKKAHWGFFRPKNPTASAGCKPANLGTKGQHATSRSLKALTLNIQQLVYVVHLCWRTSILPTVSQRMTYTNCCLCRVVPPDDSGFRGLVVSVLASGTQDWGFKPGRSCRIFRAKKSFPRRGSKAVCPMTQTPGNYVEVGFPGQICRPFLAHFRSSLPEGSHVAWRAEQQAVHKGPASLRPGCDGVVST